MGTYYKSEEAGLQGEMGYAAEDLLFGYRIGIPPRFVRNGRIEWKNVRTRPHLHLTLRDKRCDS